MNLLITLHNAVFHKFVELNFLLELLELLDGPCYREIEDN